MKVALTSGARLSCEVAATGSANAAWAPAVRSVDLSPGEDFKTPAARRAAAVTRNIRTAHINFVKEGLCSPTSMSDF